MAPLKQIGSVITVTVNSAAANELNNAVKNALPFARGLILKPLAAGITGTIPAPDDGMLYREIFVANAGSYKMTVNGVGLPAGSFATAVLIAGNFKLRLQAVTSPLQLYDGGINVDPNGLVASGNAMYVFKGAATTDLSAPPSPKAPWGVIGPDPGFRAAATTGAAGSTSAVGLDITGQTHNSNSLVTYAANNLVRVNMAGLYRVLGTVAYAPTATNQRWAILYKNGLPLEGCAVSTPGVNGLGNYTTPCVRTTLKLAANDTLQLVMLEGAPVAAANVVGQYGSCLSLSYVGPE